jgi:hypothetical protein
MDSSLINMLWARGPLPWYVRAAIKSFIHHGHTVNLYSYDSGYELPAGCVGMNANDVIPGNQLFGYRNGPLAGYLSGFANWFRYELLYAKGGWWADSDIICMKPFVSCSKHVFASEWSAELPKHVNNNVIYIAEKNDCLMEYCARECRKRKDCIEHGETGPLLLNRVVRQMGLSSDIADVDIFNPVHCADVRLLMQSRIYVASVRVSRKIRNLRPVMLTRRSRGLHLFSASFNRQVAVRTEADIPESSVLAAVLRANGAL